MNPSTKVSEDENKKTWKNAVKCPHIVSFVLVAFVAIGTLVPMHKYNNGFGIENLVLLKEEKGVDKNGPIPGCNLFSGKWIYDNVSYPLYKEEQCSVMGLFKFPACGKNVKKHFKYLNWRWQPHNCDLPRFNVSAFLETLRGKKLIFIGDSLGRNQWESMFCLIVSQIPPSPQKSWKLETEGNSVNFLSTEYNATIGFYWSPFLVESNTDRPSGHAANNCTLRIKSIEKHGRQWMDADFLVFDSFAWWVVSPTTTILWGSFDDPNAIYKTVNVSARLYEMALTTWADWLEVQINPKKTKIFFTSHSPFHSGTTVPKKFQCYDNEDPILDEKHWPSSVNRDLMKVVESVIEKLEKRGVKVEYMNITQLSGYRVDAHPGPISNTSKDCLHWCLPGLPDVWNQILYAYIMMS